MNRTTRWPGPGADQGGHGGNQGRRDGGHGARRDEDDHDRPCPGHYVFFCNLPAHYQEGMHVDVTVA